MSKAAVSFAAMKRTALIVGAGIGGLSAGIALQRAGWQVRVFERAASARELGFGLLLAPNAIAALGELGVADAVTARGFTPTHGEVRRLDGTILKRVRLPPPEALGGPTVVALRSALHGTLLDAVGEGVVSFGSEATGFTATDARVTLHLVNGGDAQGDLLVGADGAGSAIRRAIHPTEPPPRSSGIVVVRGIAHDAVRHLGALSGVYYLGPGVESIVTRAGETGVYWTLSVARELTPPGTRDPEAILTRILPGADATLRAITSSADELRCDEPADRDPLVFWGRGVVTLLGDAAHPLLPHTGQGAAQAIVDAVTLGTMLGAHAEVTKALRSYERVRIPRTSSLVRQGRRTAGIMRAVNPLLCLARELAVRLTPVTAMVRLFARVNRRAGTDMSTHRNA